MIASCTDKDFSFSDIDSTIGIGNGDFTIYGNNSTELVPLGKVLELKESDFVRIAENGDYVFMRCDSNQKTSVSVLDPIVLSAKTYVAYELYEDLSKWLPNSGKRRAMAGFSIPLEGTLLSFEYESMDVPKEITALEHIGGRGEMALHVKMSEQTARFLKKVQHFELQLPAYMEIENASLNGISCEVSSDNRIMMDDVRVVNGVIIVKATVVGMNLRNDASHGDLIEFIPGKKVSVKGTVTAHCKIDITDIDFGAILSSFPEIRIGAVLEEHADVVIESATGCFDYTFEYDDLGSFELNNIPDFLDDLDVCLDLYDPHLNLAFYNELPVDGLLSGNIVSRDEDNNELAIVKVPEFRIRGNGQTVVSIRKKNSTTKGDTVVVVVPNMTDVIKRIPHSLSLEDVKARSDSHKTGTVVLGKEYTISSDLELIAPLAFDDEAQIEYVDTVSGLNNTLKKLSLKENAQGKLDGYLIAEGDIENKIPAYLQLSVFALDLNGDSIRSDRIEFEVNNVIAGSKDGSAVVTHVIVKGTPRDNEVFRQMDSICFRIVGSATDEAGNNPLSGVTLNAEKQTLKASNVVVRIHGVWVGDFN